MEREGGEVREGCERFNEVSLSFSGRHKQEDSLFEEMLQVSQAIVSYMYLQMPAYMYIHVHVHVQCTCPYTIPVCACMYIHVHVQMYK